MSSPKPKIALIGYGKMGKEIEAIAKDRGFTITDIFEIDNQLDTSRKYDFDVAIDFTTPSSVIRNIKNVAQLGKNLVVGTTGWYDKIDEIKQIIESNKVGLIYSANFSVGIQILLKLVEEVANILNKINNYDIAIVEMHHRHKKDAPSGTALKIAERILKNCKTKEKISTSHSEIDNKSLQISSLRVGEIFGLHRIILDSESDTIELLHSAKNRKGFALGALLAAEWIFGKKGFFEFGI